MNIATLNTALELNGFCAMYTNESTSTTVELVTGDYVPTFTRTESGITLDAVNEAGNVLTDVRPLGGRPILTEDDALAALEYFMELTGASNDPKLLHG